MMRVDLKGREANRDSATTVDHVECIEAGFIPPAELIGDWSGAVHTYQGEVPLTLSFKETGDVHARVGEQMKTLNISIMNSTEMAVRM